MGESRSSRPAMTTRGASRSPCPSGHRITSEGVANKVSSARSGFSARGAADRRWLTGSRRCNPCRWE
eukprot:10041776-Heterocapsa_arctica.AAC.1